MRKWLLCTYFLGLLTSCTFAYRYHTIDVEHGLFLGKTAKDDLPFSVCDSTAEAKHPCVMLYLDEYFKFLKDLKKAQDDLIACQKGKL